MSVCLIHSANNTYGNETASDVIGCIEEAKDNQIRGWVFSLSGESIEFQLLLNGVEMEHQVECCERKDVANKYGESARQSGFVIQALLSNAGIKDTEVGGQADMRILANGVSLRWFGEGAARSRAKVTTDAKPITLIGSNLDAVERFVVRGWAIPQDGDDCEITVQVNGQQLTCPVAKVERKDVSIAYDLLADDVGFEILLPGCMWELCLDDEHCTVEVFINGVMAAKSPATVHKAQVIEWLTAIAEEPDLELRERLALLALEHVKYARLYSSLPEQARTFVDDTLHASGLEGYIDEVQVSSPSAMEPQETVGRLALRSAMYELNELLATGSGTVYEHIKGVYERNALCGVAKEWYLNLAIQLTCDKGEFERLYELTDFRYLDALKTSRQPHQLALLLPVLVTLGEIEQATGVVRSIARNINNSWLQTECLAYALQYVRKLEMKREVDIQVAEGFRNAFLAVLDGMRGEWFSRLHDLRLVTAVADMLAELTLYTDYHGRDLVAAAIRHYGLSPVFWERMQRAGAECNDPELCRAQKAWQTIHEAVAGEGLMTEMELTEAIDALEFFAERENGEAPGFVNELLAGFLGNTGQDAQALSQKVEKQLARHVAADRLRYAAHPLFSAVLPGSSETGPSSELIRLQRGVSDYRKSPLYQLQQDAASALSAMHEAGSGAEGDLKTVAEWLAAVEKRATLLGSPQGGYLGVDVLLNAYCMGARCGYRPPSVLMRAGEMIREAIAQSTAKGGIPAPIVSVLSRLCTESDDPNLQSLIAEMRGLMRAKFGNEYEVLFASDKCETAHEQYSPYQDTLLLIDIKQDEPEHGAEAIRESWLKLAENSGIPYLFVVCGKQDGVKGDVLELNVAEGPGQPVQKTLKMFEWAVRNSSAQYMVKVDAGCYLDIERYIGSLSYRKFHYYGKVVRGLGQKMSRTWHQAAADSDVAQKSLDKSPGNSVFANGTLAYSLSRYAVLKLAAALRMDRGKRLVAVSMAEDKLIGDLLSLVRITPSDEDFESYADNYAVHAVFPEQVNGNSFFPGKNSSCKMVGKTGVLSLQELDCHRQEQELWPKKIWPTFVRPSLKANSNQLELLSDAAAMTELLKQEVVVVSVVRNEMTLLPQFLEHYRKLGVGCFIFVDNCSDDGSRQYLLSQPDTIIYSSNTEYRQSHYGVSWQQAVLGNHCLGKWVLLADADEFLVYQDSESLSLQDFVRQLESQKANAALLYMIDMYPYGSLQDARFDDNNIFEVAPYFDRKPLLELRFGRGMYSNSRNFVNGLRHRVAPSRINAYVSQKYALFKYYPWVRMSEGVHYAANTSVASTPAFFAHFKYHAGFKQKVELEVRRKQHFNGAEEYKKYSGMMAEIAGGFGVEGVSERYDGSQSFLRLLESLE